MHNLCNIDLDIPRPGGLYKLGFLRKFACAVAVLIGMEHHIASGN